MLKQTHMLISILLLLSTFACDDSDSGDSIDAGESMAGESMDGEGMAGESMAGESMAGESMAGEGMAGEGMTGETISGLSDDERVTFCETRLASFISTVNPESEETQALAEKSCLMMGLIEGTDEVSCEMLRDECKDEAANFDSEEWMNDCLMNEEFFDTCMAAPSEIIECEASVTQSSIDAFNALDFGDVTCADAGDFMALMGIFGQLQSLVPSEDICDPEAMMCLGVGTMEEDIE